MSLNVYRRRRDFSITPEPQGGEEPIVSAKKMFVVQRHAASVLHYDLRIEVDGVLKSWAIPKGPSMNPEDRRLAICMEDHPLSYAFFKGTIPEGNYGAGTVDVWDRGVFKPHTSDDSDVDRQIRRQLKAGSLRFSLKGKHLKGVFTLFRIPDASGKLWLLRKGNDKFGVDYPYDSEAFRHLRSSLSRRTFSHFSLQSQTL